MLKFHDKENFVEIALINLEEDRSLPSYGDALISIRVQSNGITGQNDLWVSSESIVSFGNSLIELENKRIGKSTLISISPGELELKVFALDSLGHIGVAGKTSYSILSDKVPFKHSVEFGFEFDPSQLIEVINSKLFKKLINPNT